MKLKINLDDLETQILGLENESVTVGILNKNFTAAKIDFDQGIRTKSDPNTGQSYQTRHPLRIGRTKNTPLYKVAKWLDKQRGIFTHAMDNPNNKDLLEVAREFAILDKSATDIKRLENACRAIVRNPILRKDYGSNSPTTISGGIGYNGYNVRGKGFDHFAIATGTLFNNIKAKYNA